MNSEKGLLDILDLFTDLSDEEREKVLDKFLPSLHYMNYDETKEALAFLRSQKVYITKASEVKVLTCDNFAKKFDILREVNATDLYSQNPEALIWDALDIFKKIKYCLQTGHGYKNIDGTYKSFLFSSSEWGLEFSKEKAPVKEEAKPLEPEEPKVTLEPFEIALDDEGDIEKYDNFMAESSKDMQDLSDKIQSFEEIKSNLETPSSTLEESEDDRRTSMENELGLADLDTLDSTFETTDTYNHSMYASPSGTSTGKSRSELVDEFNDVFSFADVPVEEYSVDAGGRGR